MTLMIEEVHADGAWATATSLEARAALLRIILRSVLSIAGVDHVSSYRYEENDDPAYGGGRRFQILEQNAEEIDRRWLENLRLFVSEEELEQFVTRCAIAIRPGCHRGTILADTLRIELHFDACEPTSIAWTLPLGISLDPDAHAAIIEDAARLENIADVAFTYKL